MPEYVIKGRDMDDAMIHEVINATKEALNDYTVNKEQAEYIKNLFDKKYGPTWHCIIGKDFGSYVTYQSQHMIQFTMDGYTILLYKTK